MRNFLVVEKERLISFLFLAPLFITVIQIPTVSLRQRLYLQFVFYPIILLFVTRNIVIRSMILFLLLLFFNLYKEDCGHIGEVYFESVKIMMYVVAAFVVFRSVNLDVFLEVFVAFVKVSICVIFFSFILAHATGIQIFIDNGYNQIRPHALFSEPSATALPFAIFSSLCGLYKKHCWMGLCVAAALISGSVISAAMVIFSVLFSMAIISGLFSAKVLTFIAVAVIGFTVIFMSPQAIEFVRPISERLYTGLLAIVTWGEEGHNPRFITTQLVLEQLEDNSSMLSGLGFEINSCYNEGLQWSYDASFLIFILRSFGIIGVFLVAILAFFVMFRSAWKYDNGLDRGLYVAFTVAFIALAINGAQGLLYYTFLLLIGTYSLTSGSAVKR